MARKREFDQTAVLEQAMYLFWEKGFEGTSVHDLKLAMGISTSSMYEVFGDKRGIFLAALARFCEMEQAQLLELAGETPSAVAFVERLFDSVEVIAQNRGVNQGSLAFNAMVEFGTRDAGVTELIFSHYLQVAEIISGVLAEAQGTASITTRYEAQNLAHLILSTLHGVAAVKGSIPSYDYIGPIKQIILGVLEY